MKRYGELGIQFFNPQVEDWKPEDAEAEADHLAEDAIILFPITGETYGTGSLAETGFSALQAIKLNRHRDFVVMIERELDPALNDPAARKESLRSRALVRKHLEKTEPRQPLRRRFARRHAGAQPGAARHRPDAAAC